MSCPAECCTDNRCCCGCCRVLRNLCPDSNTTLCSILSLLTVWTLFDLLCCRFLCDCLCRFFSFFLLLTILAKTIVYIFRSIVALLQLAADFYYFKVDVECKIAHLESSLHCIEVGEYSVSVCPKCRQDCGDPPPKVLVELGRHCASKCEPSSTPRSDRRSVTK